AKHDPWRGSASRQNPRPRPDGTLRGALSPFGSQEPLSRKPEGVMDEIKVGVPGLRPQVPEGYPSRQKRWPMGKELDANGVSVQPPRRMTDVGETNAEYK